MIYVVMNGQLFQSWRAILHSRQSKCSGDYMRGREDTGVVPRKNYQSIKRIVSREHINVGIGGQRGPAVCS